MKRNKNFKQFYKKPLMGENKIFTRKDSKLGLIHIKASKILNTKYQIYLSDNLFLKPKRFHIIEKNINNILKVMKINDNFPIFILVSDKDMEAYGAYIVSLQRFAAVFKTAQNKLQ